MAAALVAVVAGALLAAFSGGVRVWARARSWDEAYVQALLGLEQVERDVRNVTVTRLDRFDGDEAHLAIPSVVRIPGKAGTEEWPGIIRYEAGAGTRTLACHALPRGSEDGASVSVVMSAVDEVRFAFCEPARGSGAGNWVSAWSGRTNLPAAVKVRVKLGGSRGPREMERILVLPIQ